MRFSSFFRTSPKALRGLGDVTCERNLLKQLAAQFFYNLTGTAAESQAALEAFLNAYLGSMEYAANPVFPAGEGLLSLLQSYMVEFLGDSPDADTLLAISPLTTESLTNWSGRVEIPAQPRTRVQAEASMLLCQTPAVDPAAATRTTAERARRDAETARIAAATAATTAATATGTPAATAARAEAAVAAVAAAVAAQFATVATEAAAETPATPRPGGFVFNPRSPFQMDLTIAQRAAILAAQYGSGGGGADTTTSYLPYIAGGGLLLLAAAVFASKSTKRAASERAAS